MNLRTFALGLIWAGLSALGPALIGVTDDYQHNEFTDWHKLQRQSIAMALIGVGGYWQKHKALLKLPPYLTGETSEVTTVSKSAPGTIIISTTQETEVKPTQPPEAPGA